MQGGAINAPPRQAPGLPPLPISPGLVGPSPEASEHCPAKSLQRGGRVAILGTQNRSASLLCHASAWPHGLRGWFPLWALRQFPNLARRWYFVPGTSDEQRQTPCTPAQVVTTCRRAGWEYNSGSLGSYVHPLPCSAVVWLPTPCIPDLLSLLRCNGALLVRTPQKLRRT